MQYDLGTCGCEMKRTTNVRECMFFPATFLLAPRKRGPIASCGAFFALTVSITNHRQHSLVVVVLVVVVAVGTLAEYRCSVSAHDWSAVSLILFVDFAQPLHLTLFELIIVSKRQYVDSI